MGMGEGKSRGGAGEPRHWSSPGDWRLASAFAVSISLFVLGLFYYWFSVADRYTIFLYGHLGATPFDEITSSRYWMSGLVTSGMVSIAYMFLNWLLGRIAILCRLGYCPPVWWHVWLICAPLVAVGVPIITMNVNRPTLPLSTATICAVVTLAGLAVALIPGALAAQRPSDLWWLMFDGIGLMPSLLTLHVIELPDRGSVTSGTAYLMAFGSIFVGVLWLGIMTGLRAWWHTPWPRARMIFLAGLSLSYLVMPLAHYLLFTPASYRYISASSNFFPHSIWIQLMVFFVAVNLALGVTRLRRQVAANASPF